MWCIGRITAEYRERMHDVWALYAKPYDPQEPVICLDEKSKQLLEQTRQPLPASPGQLVREDYEYRRAGTRNLFVAVEPKGGRRAVGVYATARSIHLVLDNLNTHFRGSFEQVLGVEAARQFLARIEFHYTPKPARWLNIAEIELGILDRQCLGRRIGSENRLKAEVSAWEQRRNEAGCQIQWTFTR